MSAPRESLERELLREMASALGRAEAKVNLALLELERAGEEGRRARRPREHRGLQRQARPRARGAARAAHPPRRPALPRDPRFEQRYPIPPRRRLPDE
ncbi:MAG: hypothetical protein M5U28_11050 [Sandaracinaceae bacterium]|nr:hypothetical protein [Sandaracinaceae bacterium]